MATTKHDGVKRTNEALHVYDATMRAGEEQPDSKYDGLTRVSEDCKMHVCVGTTSEQVYDGPCRVLAIVNGTTGSSLAKLQTYAGTDVTPDMSVLARNQFELHGLRFPDGLSVEAFANCVILYKEAKFSD